MQIPKCKIIFPLINHVWQWLHWPTYYAFVRCCFLLLLSPLFLSLQTPGFFHTYIHTSSYKWKYTFAKIPEIFVYAQQNIIACNNRIIYRNNNTEKATQKIVELQISLFIFNVFLSQILKRWKKFYKLWINLLKVLRNCKDFANMNFFFINLTKTFKV